MLTADFDASSHIFIDFGFVSLISMERMLACEESREGASFQPDTPAAVIKCAHIRAGRSLKIENWTRKLHENRKMHSFY